MVDRPILFSGAMVRALLDGRKTQTRRVLKPQPPADLGLVGIYAPKLTAVFGYVTPDADCKIPLRYMPGDRLWVREKIAYRHKIPADKNRDERWYTPHYCADGEPTGYGVSDIKPAMFMPRWASRLTLIVTDVRVQRLQEISEEDALAEGCYRQDEANPCAKPGIKGFYYTWQEINAHRGYGWHENPWVVAISFEVIKANIDSLSREAA